MLTGIGQPRPDRPTAVMLEDSPQLVGEGVEHDEPPLRRFSRAGASDRPLHERALQLEAALAARAGKKQQQGGVLTSLARETEQLRGCLDRVGIYLRQHMEQVSDQLDLRDAAASARVSNCPSVVPPIPAFGAAMSNGNCSPTSSPPCSARMKSRGNKITQSRAAGMNSPLHSPRAPLHGAHPRAMSGRVSPPQSPTLGNSSPWSAQPRALSAPTFEPPPDLMREPNAEPPADAQPQKVIHTNSELAREADEALRSLTLGTLDDKPSRTLGMSPTMGLADTLQNKDHEGDWRYALVEVPPMVRFLVNLQVFLASQRPSYLRGRLLRFAQWYEALLSEQEPPRSGMLATIVGGWKFQTFIYVIIVVNTIFTAWAMDQEIAHYAEGDPFNPHAIVDSVQGMFLCVYIIEMCLKIFVHRKFFFLGHDAVLNRFDLTLVMIDIVDTFVQHVIVTGEGNETISWYRVLRMARVGRILRAVRALRLFEELRIMLDCILWSFGQLFWTILVILITVYLFSLFFTSGVVQYVKGDSSVPEGWKQVRISFGGISRTALTLFEVTSGGSDWREAYNSAVIIGGAYPLLFLFYIAFFTLVMFNIVTSMFLDKVLKHAEPSPEAMLEDKEQAETKDMLEFREFLKDFDSNHDGVLSMEEFLAALHNHRKLGAILAARGIDIKEAKAFFQIMKSEVADGLVSVEHLVKSCARLRGYATAVDLAILRNEMRTNQLGILRATQTIIEAVGAKKPGVQQAAGLRHWRGAQTQQEGPPTADPM